MERRFYIFLAAQIGAAIALLFVLARLPGPWDVTRYAGFVLVVLGMVLVFTARFQLGQSFSVIPRARVLVSHGLYSKIRNPIYIFGILVLAGAILIFRRPILWVFLAVVIPVQVVRARREAKVLKEKFGDSYRDYRRKTWF
ncbi:MAG TPA: isoprenylcysteine carboxylmethyltransferase family protein [Terriglobales bacterium]|nr:isoprenylcysteine carboxylmethyltransferase family protein [Terriglobales bacterium]